MAEHERQADRVDEFDLARLDDAYAEAPDEEKFKALPDGQYEVSVERVELKRSKTSQRKMLEWELRIVGPSNIGRKLWKYTLLESPENVAWAKQDFRRIGFHLEKLSDLPSRLDELLDLRVEITKRTQGEFDQVYFRKRLQNS